MYPDNVRKRNNETGGNFSGSEHVIIFLVLFLQKETGSSVLLESSGIAGSLSKNKQKQEEGSIIGTFYLTFSYLTCIVL